MYRSAVFMKFTSRAATSYRSIEEPRTSNGVNKSRRGLHTQLMGDMYRSSINS